jgi:hypothetical protein
MCEHVKSRPPERSASGDSPWFVHLRPGLPLHLDGINMEARVQGPCVYAALLAGAEF